MNTVNLDTIRKEIVFEMMSHYEYPHIKTLQVVHSVAAAPQGSILSSGYHLYGGSGPFLVRVGFSNLSTKHTSVWIGEI